YNEHARLGGSKISRRFLMTIAQRDSVHDDCRAAHLRETDCVARHVRFELRNVVANYPFESSRGFPGSEPNCGQGDPSRLSCSAGDTQLEAGSAGIFSKRSAWLLASIRHRREGANLPRSLP